MAVTLQKIFDDAWQAFIVENRPPAMEKDPGGTWLCRYETTDGRQCAIGLQLAGYEEAETYFGTFEDLIKEDLTPELWADDVLSLDPEQLIDVQERLHDNLCCEDEWSFSLETRARIYLSLAAEYGLNTDGKELPDGDQ